MASNNWKETAELVGIAAIVLSLVFVGFQLLLDRQVSVVDARSGLTDRVISLTEIVNNDADVWKRGLDNEGANAGRGSEILRALQSCSVPHFYAVGEMGPYWSS